MTKEEMSAKAIDILAEEFEVDKEDITPDADIKKTLDLDSLSLVDLVALIEENFDIKIKGTDLMQTATFSQLYDFLYARISAK